MSKLLIIKRICPQAVVPSRKSKYILEEVKRFVFIAGIVRAPWPLMICYTVFYRYLGITKRSPDLSEDNGMWSCNSGSIFTNFTTLETFNIRHQDCCQDQDVCGSSMSHNRVSFNKHSRHQSFPVVTNKPLSSDGDMISWWWMKNCKKKKAPTMTHLHFHSYDHNQNVSISVQWTKQSKSDS